MLIVFSAEWFLARDTPRDPRINYFLVYIGTPKTDGPGPFRFLECTRPFSEEAVFSAACAELRNEMEYNHAWW